LLITSTARTQLQTLKEIVRDNRAIPIRRSPKANCYVSDSDGGALVFRTSPEAPVFVRILESARN